MLDNALRDLNVIRPTTVVLHRNVDVEAQLKQVVDWLSWSLTGTEAIWSLIHAGLLIQTSTNLHNFSPSIGWTTVVPGSGGRSSGWQFDKLGAVFPAQVARSRINDGNEMLVDPDLYLKELAIPKLHPDIEDAIREAVRCFRAELYTACIVMLGKASEGAWIELAVALVNAVAETDSAKLDRLREDFDRAECRFRKEAARNSEAVRDPTRCIQNHRAAKQRHSR
jgi:hypothetical protein